MVLNLPFLLKTFYLDKLELLAQIHLLLFELKMVKMIFSGMRDLSLQEINYMESELSILVIQFI